MSGLSLKQHKIQRKFLVKHQAQKLAKKSSIFRFNFFSWLKNLLKSWCTK